MRRRIKSALTGMCGTHLLYPANLLNFTSITQLVTGRPAVHSNGVKGQ